MAYSRIKRLWRTSTPICISNNLFWNLPYNLYWETVCWTLSDTELQDNTKCIQILIVCRWSIWVQNDINYIWHKKSNTQYQPSYYDISTALLNVSIHGGCLGIPEDDIHRQCGVQRILWKTTGTFSDWIMIMLVEVRWLITVQFKIRNSYLWCWTASLGDCKIWGGGEEYITESMHTN